MVKKKSNILLSTPRSLNKIRHDMLKSAKTRSIKKNIDFDITIKEIVIPKYCPIMKKELICNSKYSPTLDRKDNTKGYVVGNVAVISKLANNMKANSNYEEMRVFVKHILKYMKKNDTQSSKISKS
jgi:flagellar basal body rod protein FlgC